MEIKLFKRKNGHSVPDILQSEIRESTKKDQSVPDLVNLLDELAVSYEEKGKLAAISKLDANIRELEIKCLKQHLMILIKKSIIYYETQINNVDYSIGLMSKQGNDESVDRLKSHKELSVKHLNTALSYQNDLVIGNGLTKHVEDTYNLGYQKGIIITTQFN